MRNFCSRCLFLEKVRKEEKTIFLLNYLSLKDTLGLTYIFILGEDSRSCLTLTFLSGTCLEIEKSKIQMNQPLLLSNQLLHVAIRNS